MSTRLSNESNVARSHIPDEELAEDAFIAPYNIELAKATEQREKDMTFWESVRADQRLILYTVGFSGTIIMEGYGLAMITYLFSFRTFKNDYGIEQDDGSGKELSYLVRVMLPLVAQLGSLIGIAIADPMTNRWGYKKTVLVMLVVSAAFITLIVFGTNIGVYIAGFFLCGIPWGVYQVVSPAYASEVASLQLRPILTTWNNLCWVIGQLLASALAKGFEGVHINSWGGSWNYRIPLGLLWLLCTGLFVAILTAPESPYWYLKKGRTQDARNSTERLTRPGDAEAKLALMQHTIYLEISEDVKNKLNDKTPTSVLSRFKSECFEGVDRRRTEIASVAWLIQSLCGSSIIPWAPNLFQSAGLSASDALSINIALPAAGIVGTLVSWWLMQKTGRRVIYLAGLASMGVLLGVCGAFGFAPDNIAGWGAGATLIVNTFIYDLTVGPVCYSIVAEIPSIRLRTASLSVARGCYLLAGVANNVLTPKMVGKDKESWGWGAKTGFVYCFFCLLGYIYTWFRIPETSGISARELDVLFHNHAKAREFSCEKAAAYESVNPRRLSVSAMSQLSLASIGRNKE